MPTFTVHQPPPKKGETESAPERFVFVRDGFHFWAFVLAPLWLLLHRLWLALACYLVLSFAIGVALFWIGVSSPVQLLASTLIALLIGFEAPTMWRWTLARRKWKTLGFVVGANAEMAERRFYAEWTKNTGMRADVKPAAPELKYATPIWRGAPSPSDVIGLFPEPGNRR